MNNDTNIKQVSSQKSVSFSRVVSLLLSVVLLISALPFAKTAAKEDVLVLSDCTSGWSYGGNSVIDYSVSGTEGTALQVNGSYGVMRRLSYNMPVTDISGYNGIVWDMRCVNSAGEDVLAQVLSSYSDTVCFILTDSLGTEYKFPLSKMNITVISNGWYHAAVNLADAVGVDLKKVNKIAVSVLEKIAFCEDLPNCSWRVDSFKAVIIPAAKPVMLGAQKNGKDDVRFLASVSKSAYEQLKNEYSMVETGFLVGYASDFKNVPLEFASGRPYTNYSSGRLCTVPGDDENLVFQLLLPKYSSGISESAEIAVRAYIICTAQNGETKIFYSDDDYCGGYVVSLEEILSAAAAKEAMGMLNNINFIEDDTPVVEVSDIPAGEKSHIAGEPYAVDLKYDDGSGLCIAIYDVVRDFGAPVNDLSRDCSPHIQSAMNAAKARGGGVVYLPEGVYRCNKPITVPGGVTLRGEWVSPEMAEPASCGSIIAVYTGDITTNATPFVSLKCGGGFRNVTVIYPETANGSTAEYSATIAELPAGGSDSYTVRNVTILGGSVGFDAATAWSELHYVKDVYISSLNTGIKINNVTDIGRLEGVHISPRYLLDNALFEVSNANRSTLSDYMKTNSTGLYIQRSDWQYVYDLEINGVKRGIALESYIDVDDNYRVRGSNGQMFGVDISDCLTAIDVVYTNTIGYALTDVKISNCDNGIVFSNDYLASFEITNAKFTDSVKNPVIMKSVNNGKLTITNSLFDCADVSEYAVDISGGNVSLQQCEFTMPNKHIRAQANAGSVSVLGCTFCGMPDIYRTSGRQDYIKIDDTPLDLPVSKYSHTYRRSVPKASSKYVYDVTDYGATSGSDSTAAFKAALLAAGKTGGTVYVPKGEYYVNEPLTVPSGVELRGIYDVPTHSVVAGSVICTTYGKYNENTKAFISLEANSGINGISFYYPEQSFTDFIPYSYTVRSMGENCWAINSVFINSYNALDFASYPSKGHYINYVSGSPLRRGIYVGNNSGNGWVENVQFNPHYWKRATLSMLDTTGSDALNNAVNLTLEAMIFGDNASEHVLATFGYAAKDLLVFTSEGGKGTNGIFIGHGSDGCKNAVVAHRLDCVVMINSELVSMNATSDMHHIVMEKDVGGTLALFNTTAWAQPITSSIKMNGGNLIISQLFYHNIENTTNIAEVNGGTLYMSSAMLPKKQISFIVSNSAKIRLVADLLKQTLSNLPPDGAGNIPYSNSNGYISQAQSWWI